MSYTHEAQPPLFGMETGSNYGQSETEKAVRDLIKQIEADNLMTPVRRILCSTALRLAAIIENPKSAIAAVNAASQLTPLIEKIIGDDQTNPDDLPPELTALLKAFEVHSSV